MARCHGNNDLYIETFDLVAYPTLYCRKLKLSEVHYSLDLYGAIYMDVPRFCEGN